MQRGNLEFFKDRSLFYISRILSREEKKGNSQWNYKLPEVYFVGIMDFRFEKEEQTKYLHDVRLIEVETGKHFYDKLGFIFIELPNFVKEYKDDDTPESISEIDKWIYVLKRLDQLKELPRFLNKRVFKQLFKIAEVGNLNKEELMLYETSLKAKRDYNSAMSYAKKLAKEEGFEEGIEEGMERERLNIAKELKKEGLPTEYIARITKLSSDVIDKIIV